MKTYSPKPNEIQQDWIVIDAEGEILGRLAARVASLLRGKHKPTFAPHMDGGDHVVIVNVEKVRLTGKKLDQKTYYRHSQYPGGLKATSYRTLMAVRPELALNLAVRRMLPKSSLGLKMLKKLHVYQGGEHPHQAQKPKAA
ncbi:MAG: 50S ribosomal protein L13 [Armatimonadetes bacterium]|nr:50S ribosomal protein L13 [Armatimonadota bacterium]